MISLQFSEEDMSSIAEACDDPSLPEKIKRKLICLRMHQQNVRHGVIASVLNISANTVTTYLKEFQQDGISATLEDSAYRPSSSLEPFLQCLTCSFKVHPPKDISEAMHRIYEFTGVQLKRTQTRHILHKLGLKYRKTGVIPGKADPQLQFDFLQSKLSPRLEEASIGERKVFFVDAAHFVLGSFLGMIWCFSRIFIKSGCGRQRYNVLGALDSHSKEVITIRSKDNINSYSVCELIDKIKSHNQDEKITLVMDNAKYQRCKKVTDYAITRDIELLFLPPYSPNLNLIERLWKHLKKRALRNQHFQCFDSFCQSVDYYLDNINTSYQEELESLLTLKFQSFA